MKVGDLVKVKPERLTSWPEGTPTMGVVMEMDGSNGNGVKVDLGLGFQSWILESSIEVIPAPHAMRDNGGKPELSYALTFGDALRALALVSTYGAGKYTRDDYLKGLPLSKSADALLRHLLAWWEGEDTDPESGHGHLAHVVWNALRLCQESIVRPDLDDRFSYKK